MQSGLHIVLEDVGKHYNQDWVFKNINYEFTSGNSYAFLGSNGSGKSTLLQLIAGYIRPSAGNIKYYLDNEESIKISLQPEEIFKHLSLATPYLELIEEYTLSEALTLHANFKSFLPSMTIQESIEIMELEKAKNKSLRYFSSGMKQRVRLALAMLSDTPLLLLDEPLSNLDKLGILWYQNLMKKYSDKKLVIICSNQQTEEYNFCKHELLMENYK